MDTSREFDPSHVNKQLDQAHRAGRLVEAVRQHFVDFGPVVFRMTDIDTATAEGRCQKLILTPLERFCVDSRNVEEALHSLAEGPKPQMCGKVFKNGESTFSCRDCAVDGTCVLCMDCFQNSEHKQHRYKMHTSGGGGYCDCGDPEAWKSGHVCTTHSALEASAGQQSQDATDRLPDTVRSRVTQVIQCLLEHAVELMLWDDSEQPPIDLISCRRDQRVWCTMLFNDEVHSYDQVISALRKCIRCHDERAVEIATTVDREGRSVIKIGSYEECVAVTDAVANETREKTTRALLVKTMRWDLVVQQAIAVRIIVWLNAFLCKVEGFRVLLMRALYAHSADKAPLATSLMIHDTSIWKSARIANHSLLMSVFLKDIEAKHKLAEMFTENYGKLQEVYSEDDHEHSLCACSLSVQILTVPSVARHLIRDYHVISVIMKAFRKAIDMKLQATSSTYKFTRYERMLKLRKAMFMFFDLRYVLIGTPQPSEWDSTLRQSFVEGVTDVLKYLHNVQGMDAYTRKREKHIEYEPEWETAFNLVSRQEQSITMLIQWAATDFQVLRRCLAQCIGQLKRKQAVDAPTVSVQVCDKKVQAYVYDVSHLPVSVHLPLNRFAAGLLLAVPTLNSDPNALQQLLREAPVEWLIEPVLRCLVLSAQVNFGYWKRNGYSLLNTIIHFYQNNKFRQEMYNRDLQLLQVAASVMDSSEFLIHVMNRYGIASWLSDEASTSAFRVEESMKQFINMTEDMLVLLIYILNERYWPGVGQVTSKESKQREIIHYLCIEPMPHSKLTQFLTEDINNDTGADEVIHDVADFKLKGAGTQGLYELKKECYEQYNPFFFHFSKSDASKCEEAERKRRKAAGLPTVLVPPVPVDLTPAFEPLNELLHCDVMLRLYQCVLQRSLLGKQCLCWSDVQLERTLFILATGMRLQQKDPQMPFLPKIIYSGVIELLHRVKEKANETCRDLIVWILQQASVLERGEDMATSPTHTQQTQQLNKERARKAKRRRDKERKALAQIAKMQVNFLESHGHLMETKSSVSSLPQLNDPEQDDQSQPEAYVALGPGRSPAQARLWTADCILCQESKDIDFDTEQLMVLVAYIQRSSVMRCDRRVEVPGEKPVVPALPGTDLHLGLVTGSCSHAMHASCYTSYTENLRSRERLRHYRLRQQTHDIDKDEFLCPLCECVANTVIPMLPHSTQMPAMASADSASHIGDGAGSTEEEFGSWLQLVNETAAESCKPQKRTRRRSESLSEDVMNSTSSCSLSTAKQLTAQPELLQQIYKTSSEPTPPKLSANTVEMLSSYHKHCLSIAEGGSKDDTSPQLQVLWSTCAYTILVAEQCLRSDGSPLLNDLRKRELETLTGLVRATAVSPLLCKKPEESSSYAQYYLGVLLQHGTRDASVLTLNVFHILVPLIILLPDLFTTEKKSLTRLGFSKAGGSRNRRMAGSSRERGPSMNEQFTFRLCVLAHVTQTLIADWPDETEDKTDMEVDDAYNSWSDAFKLVNSMARESADRAFPGTTRIQLALLPFLRASALFVHLLTAVPAPAKHTEIQGGLQEFDCLCEYLALPQDIAGLLLSDVFRPTLRRWCESFARVTPVPRLLNCGPAPVRELISLPHDYSELLNRASSFVCPRSDSDDSRIPTLCLVCGTLLCSQTYCCQQKLEHRRVGAATAHAYTCGAGNAIFLRIRECQILLMMKSKRGSFQAAPYVDKYGETDMGLRRGNPLFLNTERYVRLQKLWRSHAIPETVVHALETNQSYAALDWQHM